MPPFSNKPPKRHRKKKRSVVNPQNVLVIVMVSMVLLYVRVYMLLFQRSTPSNEEVPVIRQEYRNPKKQPKRERYADWRSLAVDLAGKLPAEILQILKEEDPFGVRTFEKRLLETESSQKRFLALDELRELFPCPTDRITLPDQRDSDKAHAFRNGTDSYFLFFQHLRKAGGTNFCSLAEHNLEKKNLPKYYCSEYRLRISCYVVLFCLPVYNTYYIDGRNS